MSAGIKWPEAMPLRFDLTTGNLYNAESIALARFRHMSQGEAVANACNAAPALVSALEAFLEKFAQREAAYPTDIFPEPKWSEVSAALKVADLSTDRVSASNFRWMIGSIGKDLEQLRHALRLARGDGK